jgi:FtsZ-binding cell division protein ZapB
MTDDVVDRLTQLEEAVRRAGDAVVQLRSENEQLKREVRRFTDERRQMVGQIDVILKDIAKLDLGTTPAG